MMKSGILIFFYVDNIILTYKKDKEQKARGLMDKLKKEYTCWFIPVLTTEARIGDRLVQRACQGWADQYSELIPNW